MVKQLTRSQARRIALAAQGFDAPRPGGRVDVRHLRRVVRQLGVIQIDSVNVAVRTHYMPFFSRLGPYPRPLLDDLAYRRRELFEYWGHVASYLPTARYPSFRHRMNSIEPWPRVRGLMKDHPGYLEAVLEEVTDRGALTVGELEDPGSRTGPWWGYGKGKIALEWHFAVGNLTVADRRNFARVYDLPERVFPPELLNGAAPSAEEAYREHIAIAARALGVATAHDLADYFRLGVIPTRQTIAELVAEGRLVPVAVEGWNQPAFLHAEARLPRAVEARALLSPFDSLIWERDRTERLFDFHYRIEIYVPKPKRIYGYYVMPFLLGDRIVGRVDLKADRAARTLLVPGSFVEPGHDPHRVAVELAEELRLMAGWLGLDGVVAARNGDLAPALLAVL